MKRIISLSAFVPLMALAATSTPAGFTDDLDAAFTAAKGNGKYVYACFSGSDWCGWCKKLDQEVFAHASFLDAVTNDFELVFIDSPANASVLSERAKVENPKVTKKYGIRGFPTALIFTPEGEQIGKTGYRDGGPAKYAAHLMEFRTDGPALKKKEETKQAYVGPFRARQRKILNDLRDEIMRLQEKPIAEALMKVNALVKEFESKEMPEGMTEVREEYLEELHGLQKMMKHDDPAEEHVEEDAAEDDEED